MNKEELNKILENHMHWIKEDCEGWMDMRANLWGANLRGANLLGADLRGANLLGADLWEVNLREADLRGANLREADLRGANLLEANLRGANLLGADLWEVNLREANLWEVNLRGANLREADLRGANLLGANLREAKNIPFISMACPSDGAFIGWKKARLTAEYGSPCVIVKLQIPEDAKRSSATTNKCRCDKAEVLAIYDEDGNEIPTKTAYSEYNRQFVYEVGNVVTSEFDDDRWNECSTGIHFFINREEAEQYEL